MATGVALLAVGGVAAATSDDSSTGERSAHMMAGGETRESHGQQLRDAAIRAMHRRHMRDPAMRSMHGR